MTTDNPEPQETAVETASVPARVLEEALPTIEGQEMDIVRRGTGPVTAGGQTALAMALEFVESLDAQMALATSLVKSGFLPDAIKTPEQALAIMLNGYELGLPPMLALKRLYVVKGQVGMAAELMLALAISRARVRVSWIEKTPEVATVRIERPGWETHEETWTKEHTLRAKLQGNANHEKYPAVMNGWRALANGLRVICPDVLAGMYMIEELAPEIEIDPRTGAPLRYPSTDARVKASTDQRLEELEAEMEAASKDKPEPGASADTDEKAPEIPVAGEDKKTPGYRTHPDLPSNVLLWFKPVRWYLAVHIPPGWEIDPTAEPTNNLIHDKGKSLEDSIAVAKQWAATQEQEDTTKGDEEPNRNLDALEPKQIKALIGAEIMRIEPEAKHNPKVLQTQIRQAGLACFGTNDEDGLPRTIDQQNPDQVWVDVPALEREHLITLLLWLKEIETEGQEG